jgi:hypothetical protein
MFIHYFLGTRCIKAYIEAIRREELSSRLYWVLLAEWMMLKAFSPKWEERNAKKNSFGSFLLQCMVAFLLSFPPEKELSILLLLLSGLRISNQALAEDKFSSHLLMQKLSAASNSLHIYLMQVC